MTEDETTVLLIKGVISNLPEADRVEVMAKYAVLRKMVEESPATSIAIALIGAELATIEV